MSSPSRFEIPVTHEPSELNVAVDRVHEGFKNGSYLPLNPEGDTPTQPADLDTALSTFAAREMPSPVIPRPGVKAPQQLEVTPSTPARLVREKFIGGAAVLLTVGVLGFAGNTDYNNAKNQANASNNVHHVDSK